MYMYAPGTVFQVDEGLYKHVGVSICNGYVLHNHRERGEEAVTIDQFAAGRKVSIKPLPPVTDQAVFTRNVRYILSNPKPYHLLFSNCDHTVYKARDGIPSSPQLAGFVAAALALGTLFVAASQ